MKLLLDENLSWRIAKHLAGRCEEILHAGGLVPAVRVSDYEIFMFARKSGYVICSRDADFLKLHEQFGHPPKLVYLAVANLSLQQSFDLLDAHWADVQKLVKSDDGLLICQILPSEL